MTLLLINQAQSYREAIRSSVTSVLTRATRCHIPEDGIISSHGSGILKYYITLTCLAVYRRLNVFPVKYELGYYIPGDDILCSLRREKLKSYNMTYLCLYSASAK
jgi:hypothetical protein